MKNDTNEKYEGSAANFHDIKIVVAQVPVYQA